MHYTQFFNAEARKNWSALILPVCNGKKKKKRGNAAGVARLLNGELKRRRQQGQKCIFKSEFTLFQNSSLLYYSKPFNRPFYSFELSTLTFE